MVAVFDSPDYLFTRQQINSTGFIKRVFYLIHGILIGIIHKYSEGILFTKLAEQFLKDSFFFNFLNPIFSINDVIFKLCVIYL